MTVRHFLHTDPAATISHLFSCDGHAAGAVVDRLAEPDVCVCEAEALGPDIRYAAPLVAASAAR